MSENKVKYLEMIQAVVNRMAQNSFALKGWAVTLVTGLSAFSFLEGNRYIFLLSALPVLLFWFLDSYYLQQERKYRVLYNKAADEPSDTGLFNLKPPKANKEAKTYFYQSLFSRTEAGMYLPFMAVLLGIWAFACCI